MGFLRRARIAALAGILIILQDAESREKRRQRREGRVVKKRRRRWWVRPWILDKNLTECNTVYKLQLELEKCDPAEYKRMLRVDAPTFHYILGAIKHLISKQITHMRRRVEPDERLSLGLYYLATGASTVELARIYRIGVSTAGLVLKGVCRAIVKVLRKRHVKLPSSPDAWMQEINAFDQRWQFPGCIGALDGKHVRIRKPRNAGSVYFNYKGYHSVVLLALVNANYQFLYTDVGAEGSAADGGIWKNCDLRNDIESGQVIFPPDLELKGSDQRISCHIVADDAFPLSTRIMKPYAKRDLTDREAIFNYRCSRARRIVENVFGVITSRFRVLQSEIAFNCVVTSNIIQAIVTLHNILREVCGASYIPPGLCDAEDNNFSLLPGSWRTRDATNAPLPGLNHTQCRNPSQRAKVMRDIMADYFLTEAGAVSWQEDYIHNTQANFLRNIRTVPR